MIILEQGSKRDFKLNPEAEKEILSVCTKLDSQRSLLPFYVFALLFLGVFFAICGAVSKDPKASITGLGFILLIPLLVFFFNSIRVKRLSNTVKIIDAHTDEDFNCWSFYAQNKFSTFTRWDFRVLRAKALIRKKRNDKIKKRAEFITLRLNSNSLELNTQAKREIFSLCKKREESDRSFAKFLVFSLTSLLAASIALSFLYGSAAPVFFWVIFSIVILFVSSGYFVEEDLNNAELIDAIDSHMGNGFSCVKLYRREKLSRLTAKQLKHLRAKAIRRVKRKNKTNESHNHLISLLESK